MIFYFLISSSLDIQMLDMQFQYPSTSHNRPHKFFLYIFVEIKMKRNKKWNMNMNVNCGGRIKNGKKVLLRRKRWNCKKNNKFRPKPQKNFSFNNPFGVKVKSQLWVLCEWMLWYLHRSCSIFCQHFCRLCSHTHKKLTKARVHDREKK